MKLVAPPSPALIRAGRKHVDFYANRGQYIARGWPKKPMNPRTPAQQYHRYAFGAVSKQMHAVTGEERDAVNANAKEGNQSPRDIMMRGASGSLIGYPGKLVGPPGYNLVTDFHHMTCSSHIAVSWNTAFSGTAQAWLTEIVPTKRQIIKDVLGLKTPCGIEYQTEDAELLDTFVDNEGLYGFGVSTEFFGPIGLYVWVGGFINDAVRNFTSAMHIVQGCIPTVDHGTCIVGVNAFQPFGYNGDYVVMNATTTIEDPGGWSDVPSCAVTVPIESDYDVMGAIKYSAWRIIDVQQANGRIATNDDPRQYIDMGTGGISANPGQIQSVAGGGTVHLKAGDGVHLELKALMDNSLLLNIDDVMLVCGNQ